MVILVLNNRKKHPLMPCTEKRARLRLPHGRAVVAPLAVGHVHAKARGGTDRISNLVTACKACYESKGARSVEQFLKDDPERLARIKAQLEAPSKDAAGADSTRCASCSALSWTGFPLEASSGWRTKYNRSRSSLPKPHGLMLPTSATWNRLLTGKRRDVAPTAARSSPSTACSVATPCGRRASIASRRATWCGARYRKEKGPALTSAALAFAKRPTSTCRPPSALSRASMPALHPHPAWRRLQITAAALPFSIRRRRFPRREFYETAHRVAADRAH